MLINRRKINLRVYVIVTCDGVKSSMYVHKDGFVYYTTPRDERADYADSVLSHHQIVSSGYIDRSVYDSNPLTISQLLTFMGPGRGSRLKKNMHECFKKVYASYASVLLENDVGDGVDRFVILGADVSPSSSCDVKLLEMNKGPDFIPKDNGGDKYLKRKVCEDVITLLRTGAYPDMLCVSD